MAINKATKIKKTSANLTFKIILLVLEVLLPFGLYWAIASDQALFSAVFALGILLGMLLLVIFR